MDLSKKKRRILTKPITRNKVIDLVKSLGINDPGFEKGDNQATASKYAFEDGDKIAITLWWDLIDQIGEFPTKKINNRAFAEKQTNSLLINRGLEADRIIRKAFNKKIPVSVIINLGQRHYNKGGNATVRYRELDTEKWIVDSYDNSNGEALLVRNVQSLKQTKLTERSIPMLTVAYYLSRCGVMHAGKGSSPPKVLKADSWKIAYYIFYDSLGEGRNLSEFCNSLKNARDTYDILFENGRVGWKDRDGKQSSLGPRFNNIHSQWKNKTDSELEDYVLSIVQNHTDVNAQEQYSAITRTEGGQKFYMSKRYERSAVMREKALSRGSICEACGFDFEKVYGVLGAGFAEVHHMISLAEAGMRETDPEKDLAVLCANCHRMVHRKKGFCLTIDELKKNISKNRELNEFDARKCLELSSE